MYFSNINKGRNIINYVKKGKIKKKYQIRHSSEISNSININIIFIEHLDIYIYIYSTKRKTKYHVCITYVFFLV